MKTSLDYIRWAREQCEERDLSRGQAQVLQALASWVGRRGGCHASAERVARVVKLSPRHVHRMLRELEHAGLLVSSQRGSGRTALRQLCPAPPPDPQLSFTFGERGAADTSPTAAVSSDIYVSPAVTSGVTQKEQKEGAESTAGDARAARSPATATQPALEEVLSVIEGAPGLQIEPLAVDSALAAYPDGDHVRAAHVVASHAHEGGLRIGAANRLLLAELRKQTQPPSYRPTTRPPRHGSRRRAGPPRRLEAEEVTAARHAQQDAAIDDWTPELLEAGWTLA